VDRRATGALVSMWPHKPDQPRGLRRRAPAPARAGVGAPDVTAPGRSAPLTRHCAGAIDAPRPVTPPGRSATPDSSLRRNATNCEVAACAGPHRADNCGRAQSPGQRAAEPRSYVHRSATSALCVDVAAQARPGWRAAAPASRAAAHGRARMAPPGWTAWAADPGREPESAAAGHALHAAARILHAADYQPLTSRLPPAYRTPGQRRRAGDRGPRHVRRAGRRGVDRRAVDPLRTRSLSSANR